jgi:hypothetical protein
VSDEQVASLTGVVEPPDREATPFEDARGRVQIALAMTQERLRELRKNREEINAEIKLLVDEEDLLERMSKVRKQRKA